MPFIITIVVQALFLSSWSNALFQEGMYIEHKKVNKCHACPKLFEGFCNDGQFFHKSFLKDKQYIYIDDCDLCYGGCTQNVDGRYNCSDCKPGRWGPWCQYSCKSCSECFAAVCKLACNERNDTTACVNSKCPGRCSLGFYGLLIREKDTCPVLFCGDCRDKQCHKCLPPSYLYVQNGTQMCNRCPTTFSSCKLDTFNNNTIQAISCSTGYKLHKQDGLMRCVRCPDGCQSCRLNTFNNNTVQCTSCIQRYYLDSRSQDGMIVCSKCPKGCVECKLNTFHNNTIQCVRSAFGYYLNASNHDDIIGFRKCPKPCLSCKLDTFQNKFICLSCTIGYYLEDFYGFRDCVECPVSCETCARHLLFPTCTSCKQGYYFEQMNERFMKCTQCPNGCRACGLVSVNDKIPNCTRCEDGLSFQSKDGMSVCIDKALRVYSSLESTVACIAILVPVAAHVIVVAYINMRYM